jgi:DDE superfamily endonuclease
VLAIVRWHIEIALGLFEADDLFVRLFLFVVKGMCPKITVTTYMVQMEPTCLYFKYSILPALSLDGILAVDIVEGSFTSKKFARFIDGLLDQMNPFPGPNSIIIMDNCRIHKSEAILDMIQEQ